MMTSMIDVVPLGQAGFRFEFGETVLFIDPYLSNSVERLEGASLRRLVPIWTEPGMINDAQWVILTHTHIDHCDLDTLLPLSQSSGNCRFMGPEDVLKTLHEAGIEKDRLVLAEAKWHMLVDGVEVFPVPAAHPEIQMTPAGHSRYVGYIVKYRGRTIYHSGDTSLTPELIETLEKFSPIDVAILPVNERNYYREAQGIIGNMTIREAFQFAAGMGVSKMVPMHWDMFEPNRVYREEIELFVRLTKPAFDVILNPSSL
jgi:L-ascorbate metabolism protein UlaG (beta-lactamase superfamily)